METLILSKDSFALLLGTLAGTLARVYMLRIDYRQYPNFPHSFVTHLIMGFIAAALGAVLMPALKAADFTAVTFLALATQGFRDVRRIERESLERLEATELVPRGPAYIEGIARVFEARNYLAMTTALLTSTILEVISSFDLHLKILSGGLTAIISTAILNKTMRDKRVGDICHVRPARIEFQGPLLCVENVVLMNVGLKEAREAFIRHGISAILEPVDDDARETLGNIGLRQAIIHDVASLLGTRLDIGEKDLMPIARRDLNTGRIVLVLVPLEPDMDALVETVNRVPLLESAKRRPLASKAGRLASD